MSPEIVALINKPLLLVALLAVGALLGIAVERFVEGQKRAQRRAYWQGRNANRNIVPFKKQGRLDTADINIGKSAEGFAANQLHCVMKADFKASPLLNRPEATLFKALDAAVLARNPHWQVMAQVSLGEFLTSEDKDAYFCVNSKRVDFALMDPIAASFTRSNIKETVTMCRALQRQRAMRSRRKPCARPESVTTRLSRATRRPPN